MKFSSTLAVLSSIALASASFKYDSGTNSFICGQETGLAAYCAGGDIIIRCNNGKGYAGNCNDNLAGEQPIGNNGLAGCYQSSPSSGDAACTKAGLVYPSSGSGAQSGSPYPIPGTIMPTGGMSRNLIPTGMPRNLVPTGTAPAAYLATGASNATNSTPYKWSNSTAPTTVTVSPVPVYTAGAPSTTASPAAPEAYTGAASKGQVSAYLAVAALAGMTLF
ncbi:hypothetical protein K461DRAFT_166836 [Myriangium duriaei CBS 260.36]|uniref:Uncharacterized protein n=1 Tax=Myriangium duriaei CBS 260.36 TaxID=1168546 RepID=A0A9P4MFH9_9PEZI|nr:hypothetical protein K461DRAFT_166836 [Myriangium duriaei CBS 260.36]